MIILIIMIIIIISYSVPHESYSTSKCLLTFKDNSRSIYTSINCIAIQTYMDYS